MNSHCAAAALPGWRAWCQTERTVVCVQPLSRSTRFHFAQDPINGVAGYVPPPPRSKHANAQVPLELLSVAYRRGPGWPQLLVSILGYWHVNKARPPPSIYILRRLHVPNSHPFDWYHPFPSVTSHRISSMLLNLIHLTSGPDRSLLWGFLSTIGQVAAILASTSNANSFPPFPNHENHLQILPKVPWTQSPNVP